MLVSVAVLQAGESASADYTIVTDSVDAAGGRSSSANYTSDASLGGVVGISTAISPAGVAKHGYAGQLYDVVALQLAATPATVDEGAMRQVTAEALLDDATTLSGSLAGVAWSVLTGPIASIDTGGLATAGLVYQDGLGTIRGSYSGFGATLQLSVIDIDPDNFGLYAGDFVDDDWQVANFGEGNPDALAGEDPDGDEQDNQFEFLALVDPNDATSFFCAELRLGSVAGEADIVFSPIFPTLRTYAVMVSQNVAPAGFAPLTGATVSDAGDERRVTDADTSGVRKFYQIEISKP